MKSEDNTTVELRAPDDFFDNIQITTELSLFFQTEEKNGLLMYVGPKASSVARSKRATAGVVSSYLYTLVSFI